MKREVQRARHACWTSRWRERGISFSERDMIRGGVVASAFLIPSSLRGYGGRDSGRAGGKVIRGHGGMRSLFSWSCFWVLLPFSRRLGRELSVVLDMKVRLRSVARYLFSSSQAAQDRQTTVCMWTRSISRFDQESSASLAGCRESFSYSPRLSSASSSSLYIHTTTAVLS